MGPSAGRMDDCPRAAARARLLEDEVWCRRESSRRHPPNQEYARRGDTFSGVPLAPRLRLREVAVDADMTATLSWLRAQHGDDELLASVLELRWTDMSSVVALATRDRNLQNKARLARVPYVDVEDDI